MKTRFIWQDNEDNVFCLVEEHDNWELAELTKEFKDWAVGRIISRVCTETIK